jgi:two-component system chemotaxis response regulator CheB
MIKVLIVDDSPLVRQTLKEILNDSSGIRVVGVASDPYLAREKIKELDPDVLTLDVQLPRMDGVTFLKNIMRLRPMPVVMISTLTEEGADTTLRALELGAVDFITKPRADISRGLRVHGIEIVAKVRAAARARIRVLEESAEKNAERADGAGRDSSADAVADSIAGISSAHSPDRIIGIGASTGGTEAIKDVLRTLPPGMPGIVVTQHIPKAFSGPLARRVDKYTVLQVSEARDGEEILPGHVYIAPGNRHLLVARDGRRYICRLDDGAPVNRHKPSADVMFRSLAMSVGYNAIGVILSGMGDDGAEGLGAMKRAGAFTLVQDEKSSVVWGMPGKAAERGYADQIVALPEMAHRLVELVKETNEEGS